MSMIAILSAIATAVTSPSIQDIPKQPLTIGESYELSTHDSKRQIHVVTPAGYHETENTYPVVLMLDGGLRQDFFLALGLERWNQLWGRSAPAIFVAVETVDRQRELLPVTSDPAEMERYPTAGESSSFRKWIAESVLPLIRTHYRTDGRAFLMGESAAGHFVAESWAMQPGLFDGYAALSPSLQWNDQALSRALKEVEEKDRPPLFLSLADEGGATEEGMFRFLSKAGPSICFADRRKNLVHANALHGLLSEALQFLLPTDADWLEDFGLTMTCTSNNHRSSQ